MQRIEAGGTHRSKIVGGEGCDISKKCVECPLPECKWNRTAGRKKKGALKLK